VVDKNPSRVEFAAQNGADRVFTNLADLPGQDYDAVVDATGVTAVMSRCSEYARHGGKVLLFGVPPAQATITLEAFPIFRKGLTILSSFTSLRNSYQALDLLKSGRISLDGLISHQLPLAEFQRGIELIEQGAEGVKKIMIRPN
jgi:threonine dehydrogenase-like Zn-dependent dehydrogenase